MTVNRSRRLWGLRFRVIEVGEKEDKALEEEEEQQQQQYILYYFSECLHTATVDSVRRPLAFLD